MFDGPTIIDHYPNDEPNYIITQQQVKPSAIQSDYQDKLVEKLSKMSKLSQQRLIIITFHEI